MSIHLLNCFCRKYDLVFVEMGRNRGDEIYWFLDYNNERRFYTAIEIEEKLST